MRPSPFTTGMRKPYRILILLLVLAPILFALKIYANWEVEVEQAWNAGLSHTHLEHTKKLIMEHAREENIPDILFSKVAGETKFDWDMICFFPAYTNLEYLDVKVSGLPDIVSWFEDWFWRVAFFKDKKWIVTYTVLMGDRYWYNGPQKASCKINKSR